MVIYYFSYIIRWVYKCVCTCVHRHHNRHMEALQSNSTVTKANLKKKTFNLEFLVAEGNRVHDHKVESSHGTGVIAIRPDLLATERPGLVWDSEISNCILKAVLPSFGPHLLIISNSSTP